MNQEMMVSVICNVFNHEKYIRDALEGFVSQKTTFPFEVLVHDDASTDESARIIREYEEKYPEIIKPIYQKENQYSQGISIGWNYQTPRITGKYTAFCEGDDYWTDPMKLQKQVDFLEANPEYSLCACSTDWMNLKTGVLENRCKVEKDMDISLEQIISGSALQYFQIASVMVRSDVYKQRLDWRGKFPIGDYPLAILAALNGKVRKTADVMTVYRYFSDNSWTVRMDNDASREKVCVRMIQGLEALNEQTGYAHNEVIEKRIKKQKYTLALMRHDLETIRSGELRDLYKARSLPYRMSDVLRCKYPKIYAAVMKPLARIIKSNL